MTDSPIERTLAAARRAVPAWNAGRQQQLKWTTLGRLEAFARKRRARRFWLPVTLTASLAVCATLTLLLTGAFRGSGVEGEGGERPLARLADGSSIVLDGPTALLKKTVETSAEVAFQLEAGGAHFEVARRPSRVFRVHAGAVTVHVIGTRFHVQRQEARSHVSVDRGRVLVSWWGGSRELGAGEQGIFPPQGEPLAAASPALRRAAATATPTAGPKRHASAAAQPIDQRATGAGAEPKALFARADRARVSGRPEIAIAHLREILDRHASDPHAPVAAFTSGRLLLESLHKPREAAMAFAQARALLTAHGNNGRGTVLAEDALAREVEALHVAGDVHAAGQRAALYVRLYPRGSRLKAVMRFGGVRATP